MGNCNPRALFAFACVSSVAAEVCFLSVCFLEAEVGKENSTRSCWSNFESGASSKDAHCPFFALFLAAIVNGLLLLFTISFLLARILGSAECSLKRIPVCRITLRYGTFFTNVLTSLLVIVFIGLIIGLKSKMNFSILVKSHHWYFVLVIAGLILILIAAITSGLLAFSGSRRSADDEFESTITRSYSDHSTSGGFLDINWTDETQLKLLMV